MSTITADLQSQISVPSGVRWTPTLRVASTTAKPRKAKRANKKASLAGMNKRLDSISTQRHAMAEANGMKFFGRPTL